MAEIHVPVNTDDSVVLTFSPRAVVLRWIPALHPNPYLPQTLVSADAHVNVSLLYVGYVLATLQCSFGLKPVLFLSHLFQHFWCVKTV